MKAWALAAMLALVVLAAAEPALAQCSMCRSVLTQSPEGQRLAGSLNAAILVLLCAPYLVFASVAAVLFRARIGRYLGRLARLLLLSR